MTEIGGGRKCKQLEQQSKQNPKVIISYTLGKNLKLSNRESTGNLILLLVVSLCPHTIQTLPSTQLISHTIKFKIILVWVQGKKKNERDSHVPSIFLKQRTANASLL